MTKETSVYVAKIATKMAISSREEEEFLKKEYASSEAKVTAVNIGGNINDSIHIILERALVASKRNGLIR